MWSGDGFEWVGPLTVKHSVYGYMVWVISEVGGGSTYTPVCGIEVCQSIRMVVGNCIEEGMWMCTSVKLLCDAWCGVVAVAECGET